jgi:TatD DNase family protein
MPPSLIDSHCHLNHEKMAPGDTPAIIMERARAAGVSHALTICCQIAMEFDDVRQQAREVPGVWCTVGTHPHEAALPAEVAVTEDQIVAHVQSDPRVIGVGETGLDYYYDHSDRAAQQGSFRKHIRAAARAEVPLIVHARDADDDLIRILREEGAGADPRVRGVMHCFSGTRWLAEQSLDIGFYLSFSGILTFKKAEELRSIARDVPLDRMLVETDAPYLAPEPLRGKVNEPGFIIHTVRVLANLKNLDERGAIDHCNKNFFRLFTRAVP